MKGTTIAGTIVAGAALVVITAPTVFFLGLLGLSAAAILQHRRNKEQNGN